MYMSSCFTKWNSCIKGYRKQCHISPNLGVNLQSKFGPKLRIFILMRIFNGTGPPSCGYDLTLFQFNG